MEIDLFSNKKYKKKIISVTNLRLLSFEIHKFIIMYIIMAIISKLSNYFPISFFFQMKFNFYIITKIYLFSLIIDICFFISFKKNQGQYSYIEIIFSLIKRPNLLNILLINLSFFSLYLIIKNIKKLMPGLKSKYIKEQYKIEPIYVDDYEENYYESNGISKSTIYENFDFLFTFCATIYFLFNFVIIKQRFNLWPKLNIGHIDNLKKNIIFIISNLGILGFPIFAIVYIIILYYYHTLRILYLSLNYSSLFLFTYIFLFLSTESIINFICPKINSSTIETISKGQVIRKEIDLLNEDFFYVMHHLKNICDFYQFPNSIQLNTKLLSLENMKMLQKKIYFYIDSLNRKYSNFISKKKDFYYSINIINKMKVVRKISDYLDFSGNQVLEKDTNIEIIKTLIEIMGNIILFIADSKISRTDDEKYTIYSDFINFFIERMVEIDKILFGLIENRKISEELKNDIFKLKIIINNYFQLFKLRQSKYQFIRLETQKIHDIFNDLDKIKN